MSGAAESRTGAGESVADLFLRVRPRLWAMVARYRIRPVDAEDLIQDTFIAVFHSIASYRGESSLRTWIDTIAVRATYRYLAQRDPIAHRLQPVPDLPIAAPDPERQAQAREAIRRLYAALDRIEPKYRVAYTLHVIDGRPLKDVARVTRASVLAANGRWAACRGIALCSQ